VLCVLMLSVRVYIDISVLVALSCSDADETTTIARLLTQNCCYDLMPNSCKLVLFDVSLEVLSVRLSVCLSQRQHVRD